MKTSNGNANPSRHGGGNTAQYVQDNKSSVDLWMLFSLSYASVNGGLLLLNGKST